MSASSHEWATRRQWIGGAAAALCTAVLSGVAEPARAERAVERVGARPRGLRRPATEPWTVLPPTPAFPTPAESGHSMLDGTPIFRARFGAGNGPVVLFLHGGLGSSDHWGHQIAHLAPRFPVLAMDTRGHGRSPVESGAFSYALFARDVIALLDSLHIDKAAIVGWSDGAITGLELAMTHPDRVSRLFAFGGNFSLDGLIPDGSHAATFAEYGARCRRDYAALSPHAERWPQLIRGLRAMWGREPRYTVAQLGKIEVPTVVAAGEHDEIIRPEHTRRMADAIPGAVKRIMSGVSHFAMLQAPSRFNDELDAFLKAEL